MKPLAHAGKAAEQGSKHPPEGAPLEEGNGDETSRLCLIGLKVDPEVRREIDAYAEAHGITRSRAAAHYFAIAREARREREGIPASRADELLEALEGVRAAVDILGPPALGMLRLLAHWAVQGGGVKVSEDELLAEVRTVGADEWEQAVAEAERDLHPPSGETGQKERS
jgi:hypothetical protein